MMPITIGDLSFARAHGDDPARFDAVISIASPRADGGLPDFFLKRHGTSDALFLQFSDWTGEDPAWLAQLVSPVEAALGFAARHADRRLLVHCHAGISRSPAIAWAILAERMGPGREGEALEALFAIRPRAVPNRSVVRAADAVLGRGGALLDALDARLAVDPDLARRARRVIDLQDTWGDGWLPSIVPALTGRT